MTDLHVPLELNGDAADIAASLKSHPFFARLAATEHQDQPSTANAGADDLATRDGNMVDDITAAVTANQPDAAVQSDTTTAGTEDAGVGAATAPADGTTPAPESLTSTVPLGGYTFTQGDATIALTDEQVRSLYGLSQWAAAVKPEIAQQFAAVEHGVAVAIPTDEYAAFRTWQQMQSQSPSHPAASISGVPEWVDELDPEARAAFDRLQSDLAAAQRQLTQQQVAAQQPSITAEQDRVAAMFDQAIDSYAQSNGLTPEQAGEVFELAVQANILGKLAEDQRVYSPSGVVVREPDYALVARQALEVGAGLARVSRPDLTPAFTTNAPLSPVPGNLNIPTVAPPLPVASALPGVIPPSGAAPVLPSIIPPTAPAPTAVAPTTAIDQVALKKSRSASLAAAPSAATQPPAFDARAATPQQTRDGMAEYLRSIGAAS